LSERADRAIVVGSGPNGLAAGIVLAQAGRDVSVFEGSETLGGGCRSEELTLPGFVHDTYSTVHSLALASPFLSDLPLAEHGLELLHPGPSQPSSGFAPTDGSSADGGAGGQGGSGESAP
jgi:phytoene dehydrogenase-like protein